MTVEDGVWSLPEFTVRESARARHVRLRVTPTDGLIIVIPCGFPTDRLPGLLYERRRWLSRAMALNAAQQAELAASVVRPDRIALLSIGETWRIHWTSYGSSEIKITSNIPWNLEIRGESGTPDAWQQALRGWLIKHGRRHLIPWTRTLAGHLDVRVHDVQVRCQRTRWGSCSPRGTISLNAQLLFLPSHLVQYVLHHELCHLRHPNHSCDFWQLLETFEPENRSLRQELRHANRYVPGWLRLTTQPSHRRFCCV